MNVFVCLGRRIIRRPISNKNALAKSKAFYIKFNNTKIGSCLYRDKSTTKLNYFL